VPKVKSEEIDPSVHITAEKEILGHGRSPSKQLIEFKILGVVVINIEN